MGLSLRFVVPLLATLGILALFAVPLTDRFTMRWFVRDLDQRSEVVAAALRAPLSDARREGPNPAIAHAFEQAAADQRLFALALCDDTDRTLAATVRLPQSVGCAPAVAAAEHRPPLLALPGGAVHVHASPVTLADGSAAKLLVFNDMSFLERRSAETRAYAFALFVVLALAAAAVTVLVARLSLQGWISGVRALLQGHGLPGLIGGQRAELAPIEQEVRSLLRRLEREAGSVDTSGLWSPARLRSTLDELYPDDEVIVVSNREPYLHERVAAADDDDPPPAGSDKAGNGPAEVDTVVPPAVVTPAVVTPTVETPPNRSVRVSRPPSGLVTALEPVLRASGGTWIAHGSGSADREFVDEHDQLQVPPDATAAQYTLRRLWLSKDEIEQYYEGFSNEGMWPLCHIAHVRPVFRARDWDSYVAVNQRFAQAVVDSARRPDPLVWVQDYHLALVPQLLRRALPRATVLMFWHIPWPTAEVFGICPWREQILKGMLGSHIMGFHTPTHCRNFTDSVDAFLETRIDHESGTIRRLGQLTQVSPYPISIAWPDTLPLEAAGQVRERVRTSLGLQAAGPTHRLALGVDRLDYIKGLEERFFAVEDLLERHPRWRGRFTLLQVAAPSRSALPAYRQFRERVRAHARRVNEKWGLPGQPPPIILKLEHHGSAALDELYRAADVALVTSLHDGMNLVAKEFIAARNDERGVLVLSRFAGAARELQEALIVNPYSAQETGDAIARALSMPAAEQRERMRAMRAWVRERNVYRWAGKMLIDAARVRARERVQSRIDRYNRLPGDEAGIRAGGAPLRAVR